MQLSPGSKLLQVGPEKGIEPISALLHHVCKNETPAHLRSKFARELDAFVKHWQVSYATDAVHSKEHVQEFERAAGPMTVHRIRSACEKRQKRKTQKDDGVQSFSKTPKELAAEAAKLPATISGRLDRLATTMEGRVLRAIRNEDRAQAAVRAPEHAQPQRAQQAQEEQQRRQQQQQQQQQRLRNPFCPPVLHEEPLALLRSVMLERDRRRLAAAAASGYTIPPSSLALPQHSLPRQSQHQFGQEEQQQPQVVRINTARPLQISSASQIQTCTKRARSAEPESDAYEPLN
jgi:hypothetical protein